jgi:hypothetical protein
LTPADISFGSDFDPSLLTIFGGCSGCGRIIIVGLGSGLVTPNTIAGFALAGGTTSYGLSDGLGGGRSDMFQAAFYSTTRVNAAYVSDVSAAVAYAWYGGSTDRYVTVVGTDHLTANFSANNVGGRIEGGYRFAIPGMVGWPGRYGVPGHTTIGPSRT